MRKSPLRHNPIISITANTQTNFLKSFSKRFSVVEPDLKSKKVKIQHQKNTENYHKKYSRIVFQQKQNKDNNLPKSYFNNNIQENLRKNQTKQGRFFKHKTMKQVSEDYLVDSKQNKSKCHIQTFNDQEQDFLDNLQLFQQPRSAASTLQFTKQLVVQSFQKKIMSLQKPQLQNKIISNQFYQECTFRPRSQHEQNQEQRKKSKQYVQSKLNINRKGSNNLISENIKNRSLIKDEKKRSVSRNSTSNCYLNIMKKQLITHESNNRWNWNGQGQEQRKKLMKKFSMQDNRKTILKLNEQSRQLSSRSGRSIIQNRSKLIKNDRIEKQYLKAVKELHQKILLLNI